MRFDAGGRRREATPQQLKAEIASLEAADQQRKRDIEECTRRIDPYDPVCCHRLRHEELIRQRAADAGRLHNLRYELKCSRSVDDARDDEWRPSAGGVWLNDKY
jgi:hypothetical protein